MTLHLATMALDDLAFAYCAFSIRENQATAILNRTASQVAGRKGRHFRLRVQLDQYVLSLSACTGQQKTHVRSSSPATAGLLRLCRQLHWRYSCSMGRPATKAADLTAPRTPGSARRSARSSASAGKPLSPPTVQAQPSIDSAKAAVKQEPVASAAAGIVKSEHSPPTPASHGRKRKADAAALGAPAAVKAEVKTEVDAEVDTSVKVEPGAASAQQQPAAERTHPRQQQKQKQQRQQAPKQDPQPAAVKQEPLTPLRPSGSTRVKVEGWAAQAGAAEAAAREGGVDLGKTPTAAPLGPFPDFQRPLPEECQVQAV